MFKSLTESLNSVFNRLKGKSIISEDDFNLAMREIRIALIEADVSLEVIKKFINDVKDKVVGEKVIKSISPVQMIIKIVQDNLVTILGSKKSELNLTVKLPTVIMMIGLQGVGKTTTSGKLALKLKRQKKKIMLTSLDIYRPAAQKQLEVLGKQIGIQTLPIVTGEEPITITKRALSVAKSGNYDVLILDTAGRLHINNDMMNELKAIKKMTSPAEIILVADAMIGQSAVDIVKSFNEIIGVTGIVLTRVDGDARGGAALSMKMTTNCPIKFIACGERLSDLDDFYPDRIAKRILGMGDVISLVERAAEIVGQEEIDKLQEKIRKGKFDLNDLVRMLKTLKKMDSISNIIRFIPSSFAKKLSSGVPDDDKVKKYIAIINSMTKKEKLDPDILNGRRRLRIAKGSGTRVSDINLLIKQYDQMNAMVNKFGKVGHSRLKESDLMDMLSRK
ncbi:signal recognition particle protein [Wolbachia endosymbiont of Dirofilaria (Dirofilaria) immitis]|uniref:signal recognition particle protein n=1 Tax=Wolbachia endosymbiont of Dirofilaria (Dirofilaria) immitis TaxID=1812115 RepID=UPI00158B675D|nr:signal recognition particle protein [Wolbachia endosymbiont of Dirofilaria (Dirofilaria) immitis]QKX02560.1 signal recognition particle protein [Wolbachia endosymbiont of Dirofilaria (Dirofilaria) immitis]